MITTMAWVRVRNPLVRTLPHFLTWQSLGFRTICAGHLGFATHSDLDQDPNPPRNHLLETFEEEFEIGSRLITLETGKIARFANGAVVLGMEETKVLSTVCSAKGDSVRDFLPLTVDYQEKQFAHGVNPSTYMRREGAPKERELLRGRIIDRPIRPLFPAGFYHEVQLSLSDLNLIYACTRDKTLMIDVQAHEISEKDLEAGLRLAHPEAVKYIEPQIRLAAKARKSKKEYKLSMLSVKTLEKVTNLAEAPIKAVFTDPAYGKFERGEALDNITQDVKRVLEEEGNEESLKVLPKAVDTVRKKGVRKRIIAEGFRLEGRQLDEVRPLYCEAGILSILHGSALFNRGQTQNFLKSCRGAKVLIGTKSVKLDIMPEIRQPTKAHTDSVFYTIISMLLLLFQLLAVSLMLALLSRASDSYIYQLFEEWCQKHGKKYFSEEEKLSRFEVFKNTYAKIIHHNQMGNSYTCALNKFADLEEDEFLAAYCGHIQVPSSLHLCSNVHNRQPKKEDDILPDEVDWRKSGAVTPVFDQTPYCGCCWAIAAIGAVEGVYKIVTGSLVRLSPQELIDCSEDNLGCDGGMSDLAYKYIMKNGIGMEDDYKYEGRDQPCRINKLGRRVRIHSYARVSCAPFDERSLMKAVAAQPVSVVICNGGLYQNYTKDHVLGTDYMLYWLWGMAVLVVGYGSHNGEDFWIIKNSRGEDWGDNGYLYLLRNSGHLEGQCGIILVPTYPILRSPNPARWFSVVREWLHL